MSIRNLLDVFGIVTMTTLFSLQDIAQQSNSVTNIAHGYAKNRDGIE